VFNAAAKALLVPMGVKIIDLYSWVAEECPVPYRDPCQVHFNNDGGWLYVAQGYAAGVQMLMA